MARKVCMASPAESSLCHCERQWRPVQRQALAAAVVLRSKSPPMIRQEIYAMLCCYQAIRTLISHAADDAGIDPARVSFTCARDGIRSRISDSGCFSP
jgi:hypothetical protein